MDGGNRASHLHFLVWEYPSIRTAYRLLRSLPPSSILGPDTYRM